VRIATYVYPGWHPIPERDENFHPGFTEWELVRDCRPRFPGHRQPRVPLLGPYDDRDPIAVERRTRLALEHGVDAFIYGFFWCRGKRVFEQALDQGFLGSELGASSPFALMWANRMPRRVLPVRRQNAPVIDESRRVQSDVDDFVALIQTIAEKYFRRDNYLTVEGLPYFSIFDSTFFINELGLGQAQQAIKEARAWLTRHGFPGLHLAAIDPAAHVIEHLKDLGFDSVTHYVLLPEWKGPSLQDYRSCSDLRAAQWHQYPTLSSLPYMPSIAPGWDASPRGADFGTLRPNKYPWSPVVTGEHPQLFSDAVGRALKFESGRQHDDPLVMLASLNEWSEGHYLEPDEEFGLGWLEAVEAARKLK
jgi:hypothetical protein